jgi:hypothetical protein
MMNLSINISRVDRKVSHNMLDNMRDIDRVKDPRRDHPLTITWAIINMAELHIKVAAVVVRPTTSLKATVKGQMARKVSHLTLVKETDFLLGIHTNTSSSITTIIRILNHHKDFKVTS